MEKLIKHILSLFSMFFIQIANAQVLFDEDFDSYPMGNLINDQSSTTPDQGGWYSGATPPAIGNAIVTAESGKGNVLIITSNGVLPTGAMTFKQAQGVIGSLWNNRMVGNNILKFEYEFYGIGVFNAGGNIVSQGVGLIGVTFQSNLKRIIGGYFNNVSHTTILLKNYTTPPFPSNTWLKAETFIDYNTKNVYFYIPALNIQATGKFTHNRAPEDLSFYIGELNSTSVVKLDNIRLTALKTLPSYILSANEQLATKFNLYPNPATSVVNITNAENMVVEQVTVYDIAGKQLSIQTYNNETEIQLNVEHLASGTYILHLQTKQGTAVKKLVKK